MDKTDDSSRLIDMYIEGCPENTRPLLRTLRETIRAAAPEAVEKVSYQMPAFALEGNLVYYAAWKTHIGFCPGGSVEPFKDDLAGYKVNKGTIRFELDRPLPVDLIERIVRYRVAQNRERGVARAAVKAAKKASKKE